MRNFMSKINYAKAKHDIKVVKVALAPLLVSVAFNPAAQPLKHTTWIARFT